MTDYQHPEVDLTQTPEIARAAVAQPDQVELLATIETFRTLLYRFIPLLNSESIEIRARSSLALEKMHREIRQILANQRVLNHSYRLERWEQDGRRVGNVSE